MLVYQYHEIWLVKFVHTDKMSIKWVPQSKGISCLMNGLLGRQRQIDGFSVTRR